MSIDPTTVSIAAADSVSVHLSTTRLNDANTINLGYQPPEGVQAGEFAPRSVPPGQGVDIGFFVPSGTAPGHKGSIAITGDNGIERHSVTVDVTTTGCVPHTCQGLGLQCGASTDGCGGPLSCGMCDAGLTCSGGLCLQPRCVRSRPCPRGSHWDQIECACVGD
jgi:hypothetical protein